MKMTRKDIVFWIYILCVVVLSILYFSMPERKEFINNTIQWWKEMKILIK